MRVIVVGAGTVGSHIAESLSAEGVDVAVIEKDAERLEKLTRNLDVLAVRGNVLDHKNLKSAGVDSAFMFVAVTNSDEVNMISGLMAAQANVKHRIVRIENHYLYPEEARQLHEAMQVDVVIDPDRETAVEIVELLKNPGVIELEEITGGELVIIGAQLTDKSSLINRTLDEIAKENDPEWNFIVGSISRAGEMIIPRDKKFSLLDKDIVRVITKKKYQKEMLKQLGIVNFHIKNIMILGGGRTGEITAELLLKEGRNVTMIEKEKEKAEEISSTYDHINVIHGDISNSDLLDEENIEKMDAVIAVSGKDESNILACLYAHSKGVKEIISILHRAELNSVFTNFEIEKTLSPITASIESVLKIIRSEK